MYIEKKIKLNKLKKYKRTVIAKSQINLEIVNSIIKKYPELTSGRKNYEKKEININNNICLVKIFNLARNNKSNKIQIINTKKEKNNIIIKAIIFN